MKWDPALDRITPRRALDRRDTSPHSKAKLKAAFRRTQLGARQCRLSDTSLTDTLWLMDDAALTPPAPAGPALPIAEIAAMTAGGG